jgi:MucR family transcriptional regulator, transcriptional regulator of exopolysaccharide biosynthesis
MQVNKITWEDYMVNVDDVRKIDPSLIADIVRSYVANNSVTVAEVGALIAIIHQTLSGLGVTEPTPAPARSKPAVPVSRSVQPDHVVCLECGFRGKTLRRHLRAQHGLDIAAYRARWQLPPDHPVTAPAYSVSRSAMARQIGLGHKRAAVETSVPAPRRRGRSSGAVL